MPGTNLMIVAVCVLGATIPAATLGQDRVTAKELLQHHLDSIGTPSVRQVIASRVVEGTASYRVLVGGSGRIEGKAVLVSERRKLHLLLKVNTEQYKGEQFICDGEKTSVSGTYMDKTRSEFGDFMRGEDVPIREGILGGVLSTAWPLLDFDSRKAKLKYEGLKKIDGVDLYAVSYQPKRVTDMNITLYFDPQTFHHVLTLYTVTASAGLGMADTGDRAEETESARQQQTRYRIQERYSDFKTEDGLTLPQGYDLRFQEELQNGFTKQVEWEVHATKILNNIPVDARNFQLR